MQYRIYVIQYINRRKTVFCIRFFFSKCKTDRSYTKHACWRRMMSKKKTIFFSAIFIVFIIILIMIINAAGDLTKSSAGQAEIKKSDTTNTNAPPMSMTVGIVYDNDKNDSSNPQESGAAPQVWASYRESIGFRDYYREMTKRGVIFFAYSRNRNQWVTVGNGSKNQVFNPAQLGSQFTPTPTCIRDEPALATELRRLDVPERKIYVAKPKLLENSINAQVRHILESNSINVSTVTGVSGKYSLKGNKFNLHLTRYATQEKGSSSIKGTIIVTAHKI